MAEVTNKAIDLVKQLIVQARKSHINITKAFLFGSYANGTSHIWSDIDVALVSDDFVGNRFLDLESIAEATVSTSIDIQPHLFRPEEFTEQNPLVKEILQSGIRIV
jgi:uncharacterized protein